VGRRRVDRSLAAFGRRQAQGSVEFGVTIAVVVLLAMMGLDRIQISVYDYFTDGALSASLNPPTPTPSGASPPPPDRWAELAVSCSPVNPPPLELQVDVPCVATVWDTDSTHNGWPGLTGDVQLDTSAVGGAPGHGLIKPPVGASGESVRCVLTQGSPYSTCNFNYWPDFSGQPLPVVPYTLRQHTISARYNPDPVTTGIHGPPGQPRNTAPMQVKRYAVIRLTADCPQPVVPLEMRQVSVASRCTAYVDDVDVAPGYPPDGTLSWRVLVPLGDGTFNPSPGICTLTLVLGLHQCYIDYTPNQLGFHRLTASFVPSEQIHSAPIGIATGRMEFNVVP
jgi:hypothetical protein